MKTTDIDIVSEGPNDPHIFKAVFLAGGPGSGKSYVSSKLLAGTGLRVVNSDDIYEYMMKKQGMSLDPETIFSPAGQDTREKAKGITKRKQQSHIDGRLGLVIDGTGKDVAKYSKTKKMLEGLGYETMMLFVNTSHDVAQERNQQRARSLDPKVVSKMWNAVQENIMAFQQLFGAQNFYIVDNSGGLEDPARQENFDRVRKGIDKFINAAPKRPEAQKWLDAQKPGAQQPEEKTKQESVVEDAPVTKSQLDALERAADKVFGKLGIDIEFTRHFLDRVNDERNRKQITIKELGQLFAKEFKRWGRTIANMPVDAQAVMKDLSTEINIPFVLNPDGKEKDLVAKTVMRKKDFKTPNKQLPVESVNEGSDKPRVLRDKAISMLKAGKGERYAIIMKGDDHKLIDPDNTRQMNSAARKGWAVVAYIEDGGDTVRTDTPHKHLRLGVNESTLHEQDDAEWAKRMAASEGKMTAKGYQATGTLNYLVTDTGSDQWTVFTAKAPHNPEYFKAQMKKLMPKLGFAGYKVPAIWDGDLDDEIEYSEQLLNKDNLIQSVKFEHERKLKQYRRAREIMGNQPEAVQSDVSEARNPMSTINKHLDKKKSAERRSADLAKNPHKVKQTKKDELDEKAKSPYAIGMAQAMKSTGDKPPLKKSTIKKAHKIARSVEKNESVEQVNEKYKPGITVLTRGLSFADLDDSPLAGQFDPDKEYRTVKRIRWPYGIDVKFDDASRSVTFKTAKMKTVARILDKHIDFGATSAAEVLDLPPELMHESKSVGDRVKYRNIKSKRAKTGTVKKVDTKNGQKRYELEGGKMVYDSDLEEDERKMKDEDPCWKGYEMVGHKKKNGKEVPNCVPKKGKK